MSDDAPSKPPEPVIEQVISLVRQSRNTADDTFDFPEHCHELLDQYDYEGRIRSQDNTLVLYPADWVTDDGTANLSNIKDTDTAVEVSLEGPNHDAEWAAVEEDNAAIVATVREEHGDAHAANVRAFADFMGNYYLKRVNKATEAEREEFLEHYFERNVWATDEQEAIVAESIRLIADIDD